MQTRNFIRTFALAGLMSLGTLAVGCESDDNLSNGTDRASRSRTGDMESGGVQDSTRGTGQDGRSIGGGSRSGTGPGSGGGTGSGTGGR